jgi:hypothetical protein
MHRVNTTISWCLAHRQRNLGRHNADNQARDLFSVFLCAVCQRDSPMQIIFKPGKDILFVEAGTVAFLDLLLMN